MGLGPAVCQHCQVLAEHVEQGVPSKIDGHLQYWVCPMCGETDITDHTGFDTKRMREILENARTIKRMVDKVIGHGSK